MSQIESRDKSVSKKESGKENLNNYSKIIEESIEELGLDPKQCRTPVQYSWTMYRGSANVRISFFKVEDSNYVEFISPIMILPNNNILPLYRRLLELNHTTIGVNFAIYKDTVFLEITRELKGLDKDEALNAIRSVGNFSDEMDDKLKEEFIIHKPSDGK
jgi:hypothetical protein